VKLSVVLATYNEEKNLPRCLSSIVDVADEIVVVDGRSTDRTVAIAKEFGARVFVTKNQPMFHINKQKAVDRARGIWILQLDADEEVPRNLSEEIRFTITTPVRHVCAGYYIARKNFFIRHWLRKGGQHPDYVIRLFQNGKGRFPQKSVHEQIVIDGTIGYLKHSLFHYPYSSVRQYWTKSDRYTSLTAEQMKRDRVPIGLLSWFLYTIAKPLWVFLTMYIRHKGFLDGWYGFLFALFSSLHYPIAYAKYRRFKS